MDCGRWQIQGENANLYLMQPSYHFILDCKFFSNVQSINITVANTRRIKCKFQTGKNFSFEVINEAVSSWANRNLLIHGHKYYYYYYYSLCCCISVPMYLQWFMRKQINHMLCL